MADVACNPGKMEGPSIASIVSLVLALVAVGAAYQAVTDPTLSYQAVTNPNGFGQHGARILWVIVLVAMIGWAIAVSAVLSARGSTWLSLIPGGLLLILSLACPLFAFLGHPALLGHPPFLGHRAAFYILQQLSLPVSFMAALAAVVLNIAAAGFVAGISILLIQAPLALLLTFLLFFGSHQ